MASQELRINKFLDVCGSKLFPEFANQILFLELKMPPALPYSLLNTTTCISSDLSTCRINGESATTKPRTAPSDAKSSIVVPLTR
jgi:hypothetical protein